jgi:hypothetical protein
MAHSDPPDPSWTTKLVTWVALASASSVVIAFLELQLEAARSTAVLSSSAGAAFTWGQLLALPFLLGFAVAPLLAALERRWVIERLPSMGTLLVTGGLALGVGGVHVAGNLVLRPGRLEFYGSARTLVFWAVVAAAGLAGLASPFLVRHGDRLLKRVPRVARLLPPLLLALVTVVGVVTLHVTLGKQREITTAVQTLVVATAMLAGRAIVPRVSSRWAGPIVAVTLLWMAVAYFVPGRARAHALFVTQHSLARYTMNLALRDLIDRDGDGSAPGWLGGPDCDDGDPGRSPAVREVAGDGIDQDCRGGDAPVGAHPAVTTLPPGCRVAVPPRNVLVLVIDALRADHVTPELTPNLSGLGRGSLTFERAYSPTAHTNTSIPAFVTSRPLADLVTNVVVDDQLAAERTLPEAFGQRGYRTAVFFNLDFNPFSLRGFQERNPYVTDRSVPNVKFDLTTSSMLAGVRDWFLRTQGPKFAYAHLSDVHAPYVLDRTDDGHPRNEVEAYRAGVAYVDSRLGHFFGQLEHDGIFGRTIIVVTADHGEALMQRGKHGHGPDVFEESIRVPLIVWVPGCRPRRVARPVSTVWTGPLLGALAGFRIRGKGLFDVDDLPVVSDGSVASPAFLGRAVVLDGHKLVVDVPSGGRMLFDLTADPGETRNVYGTDPVAREQLESAYQRWLDTPGYR